MQNCPHGSHCAQLPTPSVQNLTVGHCTGANVVVVEGFCGVVVVLMVVMVVGWHTRLKFPLPWPMYPAGQACTHIPSRR